MEVLEKRMYFFVMYNISDIQKGIQAGHCVEEYISKYGNTPKYKDYQKNWKTWIVLNGGSSNNVGTTMYGDESYYGSMEDIVETIEHIGYEHACFYEPDLNNSTSAVCFLVDERVFNYKKYPTFYNWYVEKYNITDYAERARLRLELSDETNIHHSFNKSFDYWVNEIIGGVKNHSLRSLLVNKKFA